MFEPVVIPDKKELRQFGLLMAGILAGLFGLLLPWLWELPLPLWPWLLAAPFLLLGLAAPGWLGPVFRVWMTFGQAIGWVMSRVILSTVFFLLVTPFGVIMRLFGYDPLHARRENKDSYRTETTPRKREHMERPF
ncbi:MAG: SxtJ family membrane protein [Gammaproteobacteria bacterium]|jgi:hypothetical protein|nr:SxtJ family membrane protein [Gammaproteobacteria bacterium]